MSFSIMCSSSLQAAQWRFGSGVATELSHSEVTGNAVDQATSSEVVWGISPYLTLSGRGNSLDVNARLGVNHTDNTDTGETSTQPAASINSELTVVDRRVWMTLDASVARRSESTNGTAEDFLVDLSSDRRQVDFSLSERGLLTLGTSTQINASHRFSTSDISGSSEESSQTNLLNFGAVSILRNARSLVTTNLDYQHTEIEDVGVFESGEAVVGFGAHLGDPSNLVMLSIGNEWYDLGTDGTDLDGFFWVAGFRWQPVASLQFDAAYGRRSYGRAPLLRATLRGRRNTLSIQWSRQSAFQRIASSASGVFSPVTSLNGDAVDAEDGVADDPVVLDGQSSLSPFSDDLQAIDEEIRLDHEFRGRVSTLTTSVGSNRRSSIVDSDTSETALSFASLVLAREIGQSIRATAGLRIAESEEENVSGKQKINRVRLTLVWRF